MLKIIYIFKQKLYFSFHQFISIISNKIIFIFFQAVLRKWRKLRLLNIPKTILSMTMTLPLLPPEMFQEALFIIQTEADLLSSEHPNILQFMSYLRLTWSNMASKISTYCCPVRTNNIVESFHNIAVQKLGTTNINVWTFLGNVFKYFVSMFICIFY